MAICIIVKRVSITGAGLSIYTSEIFIVRSVFPLAVPSVLLSVNVHRVEPFYAPLQTVIVGYD